MTTGARRGELCALRWSNVDLDRGVITLRRAISQFGRERSEKDTKTHQQRRLTLDPETVTVLAEHWERCQERAASVGEVLGRDAFVFSLVPDSSTHLVPSSVSQRYSRLAARLGVETHLHCLRHYSATELIGAGVDVRTVAGRLGHSGGGVTTLRVYAAWLAEADQRAAAGLAGRSPARPRKSPAERALTSPRTPREHLAVELRRQILDGLYPIGTDLPGIKALASERGVSSSTVQRAYLLLRDWGLVKSTARERTRITAPARPEPEPDEPAPLGPPRARRPMIRLEVRKAGKSVARLVADVDPTDPAVLRRLLLDAIRRAGDDDDAVGCYELLVLDPHGAPVSAFVIA
jgi:hypothetical protein